MGGGRASLPRVVAQLEGLPAVPAGGGRSLLLDAEAAGPGADGLSARLLENGVAATPMGAWAEAVAPRHVRFVFSNEPVEGPALLGERVRSSLRRRSRSAGRHMIAASDGVGPAA